MTTGVTFSTSKQVESVREKKQSMLQGNLSWSVAGQSFVIFGDVVLSEIYPPSSEMKKSSTFCPFLLISKNNIQYPFSYWRESQTDRRHLLCPEYVSDVLDVFLCVAGLRLTGSCPVFFSSASLFFSYFNLVPPLSFIYLPLFVIELSWNDVYQ